MTADVPALLAQLEGALPRLSAEQLAELAGGLERVRALAWARLAAPPTAPPAPARGRLLSVREAAARMSVSADWLYRHAGDLPCARRLGRKVLFDEGALEKWLATQR